ncbi:OmpA family protein [Cupriavidus sp. 30B13]|uniref:OmpA family protein n=1 Tax=Cupriavidus sp. 30B13 TaxID=3384241 RepID=UPI003B8ED33C
MRITLPAMSFALNNVLAMVASCMSTVVFACSPVQGLDLVFRNDSAALDAENALRLGGWLAELRVHFPNYSDFGIYGHTDVSERRGKLLAKDRAETIRRFLAMRGFQADRIHVAEPGKSYNAPIAGLPTRSVQIEFVPACPHICCTLPTHEEMDHGIPMPSNAVPEAH